MRVLITVLLAAMVARANAGLPQGRLPIESFSTKQGLVNDTVSAFLSDSRGYLWIGTKEGVSRFDGERFVNYTTADGLPHGFVTSIAEARDGAIYVSTYGGVARLAATAPHARPVFKTFLRDGAPIDVKAVIEDAQGRVWSGCHVDLCRVTENGLVPDAAYRAAGGVEVQLFAVDAATRELWAGTFQGLMHRRANGTWVRTRLQPHRDTDVVHGLWIDRGLVWIGTSFGIFVATPQAIEADPAKPLGERITATYQQGDVFREPRGGEVAFIRVDGSESSVVMCGTGIRAHDGVVWIPTAAGMVRISDTITQLDEASLGTTRTSMVGEDRAHNLWIGGEIGGLVRIPPGSASTYTRAQGLRHDRVNAIFESTPGTVCIASGSTRYLHCFENGVLKSAEIVPHALFDFSGWGWNQVVAHTRNGEWWVATGQGVVRWPAVHSVTDFARVQPLGIYTEREGISGDDVFRVFEDSRGDLWLGTFGKRVLTRRDHVTGRFITYDPPPGVLLAAPTAFAEDRAGNVWIGRFSDGVLRYDGTRFAYFDRRNGMPNGFVEAMLIDSRGALWIATRHALAKIDDPTAAHPIAHRVTSLSTDGALALDELRDGTMAVGTAHGVDILDRNQKRIAHLSTSDGLAHDEVFVLHGDADGGLWIGTLAGVSYLPHLAAPVAVATPRPRIDAIDAGAAHVNLAELGSFDVRELALRWPDRRMEVTFSAPDFDARHPLQFEYRLDDEAKWTGAGRRRNIIYERLPFGAHRFEVRAVGGDGVRSPPASIALTVAAPFWRTGWFVALMLAIVAAILVALHRVRVAHLLDLQRMRTRVATDLHDDLGSSLSRISILSEVAKRRDGDRALNEIGETARTLIDALGDSIWSIDPRRDDVQSLMARLRHFAADVLEARSIAMQFDIPPALSAIQLMPDTRREIFLILKEAINNAAKHSQAKHVSITAHIDGGQLHVHVVDDGIGITPSTTPRRDGGHGLPNMNGRAVRAGGTLMVQSGAAGTRIEVAVPV